jgi:CRISPR-associated Cas5-like protein
MRDMSNDPAVEVSALAINVTIPDELRWTDSRRGQEFLLTTLNIRLLKDGHLAVKAYGRPTAGGRGAYVSFPVPPRPELAALVAAAAGRAGELWAAHRGI